MQKSNKNDPATQDQNRKTQAAEEVDEQPTCLICTGVIKYYCIPEQCNHNMICWTCMLKQRVKMDNKECPMCKETSERILITDDPDGKISNWDGRWIEEDGIVYARQDIRKEV